MFAEGSRILEILFRKGATSFRRLGGFARQILGELALAFVIASAACFAQEKAPARGTCFADK
jgi:hypothetical protein